MHTSIAAVKGIIQNFMGELSLNNTICSTHLQSRGGVETFNYLGVVKQTVGPVTDSHHTSAAAVDIDAVHVAEGQADVSG